MRHFLHIKDVRVFISLEIYLPSVHKMQVEFRSHFTGKKVQLMGREIRYILQRHQKPVHKYKMYGLKHILKCKVHIKLFVLNLSQ